MSIQSLLIQNYLKEHTLERLASITPRGLPHIVAVAYVNDDVNLYLTTFTDTKKVRNILSKAFAQGKVRRVGPGVYVAA